MQDPQPIQVLVIGETPYQTHLTRKFRQRKKYVPPDPSKVICVIPGVIQKIHVHAASAVQRNDRLLVLEAMKMQNDILSPADGTVKAVHVSVGQMVKKGEVLIELEAAT